MKIVCRLIAVMLTVCQINGASAEPVPVIKVKTAVAVAPVPVEQQTPSEKLGDFMRFEEARVCGELRAFAEKNILTDKDFISAAQDRSTRRVAKAAAKYANVLAKTMDADFVFYHPNTRFFVRVNDKNYRGRMRLPSDMAATSSACYWERLPSQDVVYSALMKIDGEKTGYLKISKKLTRMIGNVPDVLSEFGKTRVYTALDKTGLKKMAWFKMRRREPDKTKKSSWCNAEDLAFLTSIGTAKTLPKATQKKLLSLADKGKDFVWPEMNLTGGALALNGLDEERLGAVVYTIEIKPENQNIVLETNEGESCGDDDEGDDDAD